MGKAGSTNLLGEIFYVTLGAWLVGRQPVTKIQGTRLQVETVTRAMVATRNFQNELQRPGATVGTISERLEAKNVAAMEFEKVFGTSWPL